MIKRKPRRNRPVVDWPRVKAIVIERDLHQMWRQSEDAIHHHVSEREFRATRPIVCIAPVVDSMVSRKDCWGRTTLDHVKLEPRTGVKADDVPEQLVSICQGHSEDGMKAGHQWNTAHRAEERGYLRRIYG